MSNKITQPASQIEGLNKLFIEFIMDIESQKEALSAQKDLASKNRILIKLKDIAECIGIHETIFNQVYNCAIAINDDEKFNKFTERKKIDGLKNCEAVYNAFKTYVAPKGQEGNEKEYRIAWRTIELKGKKTEYLVDIRPKSIKTNCLYRNFEESENVFLAAISETEGSKIQILDTWVSDVIFPNSAYPKYEQRLAGWLKRGLSVQILVLDPMSDAFMLRAKAGLPDCDITQLRDLSLTQLERLLNLKNDKLEIRLFDALPTVNAYILEEQMFYGHFYSSNFSLRTAFHQVHKRENQWDYKNIKEDFEKLWNSNPKFDEVILKNLCDKRDLINRLCTPTRNLIVYLPQNPFYDEHQPINIVIEKHSTNHITVKCLQNSKLKGRIQDIHKHFFNCVLTDEENASVLHLTIPNNLEADEPKPIIYHFSRKKEAYSGIGMIVQDTKKDNHRDIEIWKIIRNNISRPFLKPYILPESFIKHNYDISGNYLIYSYGRKSPNDKETLIIVNKLEINADGYVEYKRSDNEVFAKGVAYFNKKNFFIELIPQNPELDMCYFMFYPNTPNKNHGTLYTGIYMGPSQYEHTPLALRVILEFFSNEEIEDTQTRYKTGRYTLYKEDYNKLPKNIAKTLTGRMENFITFTGTEGTKEITNTSLEEKVTGRNIKNNIGETYMKAACFDAFFNPKTNEHNPSPHTKTDKVVDSFKRAYKYGYTDFLEFENYLSQIDEAIYKAVHGLKSKITKDDPKIYRISKRVRDNFEYKKLREDFF